MHIYISSLSVTFTFEEQHLIYPQLPPSSYQSLSPSATNKEINSDVRKRKTYILLMKRSIMLRTTSTLEKRRNRIIINQFTLKRTLFIWADSTIIIK